MLFLNCCDCQKQLHKRNKSGYCLSCSHKRNPTRYWLGKKRPDFATWQSGRKFSPVTRQRLSESHIGLPGYWKGKMRPDMRGAEHPSWKGGHLKHPDKSIRESAFYADWRKHVFQRDDYICQACGQRGGRLQADHELPFAYFPDLRFEILNGRTLCVGCHKKTPTYSLGGRKLYGRTMP